MSPVHAFAFVKVPVLVIFFTLLTNQVLHDSVLCVAEALVLVCVLVLRELTPGRI